MIINFYGAYILRNLSSGAQQNRINNHNREQGRKSHYQNEGQPKIYGGNAIWNKHVLSFFRKIAIVSDYFKANGSSFHTLGAATEKARLPKLSLVLGPISYLGIFERCRRLAKYGSCCVDRT